MTACTLFLDPISTYSIGTFKRQLHAFSSSSNCACSAGTNGGYRFPATSPKMTGEDREILNIDAFKRRDF